VSTGDALRVPEHVRRGWVADEEESIEGAVWLIDHLCHHIGVRDLGGLDVLDVGCGVKFTQAILNRDLPLGSYVGVDVYREMLDYLRDSVDDPRFDFVHLDVRNERYNPGGRPLGESTEIPLGGRTFDVVCLFSVFTHLAPHDYQPMLRMLRRCVRPGGKLFYTIYLDELTDGGFGLVDQFSKQGDGFRLGPGEDFRDLAPDKPLLFALYAREYAERLVDGTGWRVVDVSPPAPVIQHHITCEPI
jgi:SAM-dependent methyltransferase